MSTAIYAGRNILSKVSSRQFIYLIQRSYTIGINSQTTSTSSSSSKNDYYDIVVVGGGMVGTAMAKALGLFLVKIKFAIILSIFFNFKATKGCLKI